MAATITDLANGIVVDGDVSWATGATVTGATANGDWFVALVAVPNNDSDSTGATDTITSVQDSVGNTYTLRAHIIYDPSTAGVGASLRIYTAPVTINITSGTFTVNFDSTMDQGAIQVYRVRPGAGEAISFIAVDATGSTGLVTSHAAATVSVTNGDIIFGAASIETDDAVTGDSDTTNGSWSTIITRLADGGTDANAQCISSQYKTVNATGDQSWACTTATARDSARSYLILRSIAAAKSVVADAGSYALTGTAATLRRNLPLVADPGSYALTGTDATLRRNLPIVAGAGSYVLTGTDAVPEHGWLVTAEVGSYTLTGTDASLNKGQRITADAGSYALTGSDANLLHGWKLDATTAGTYVLTGTDATPEHGWLVAAGVGSYALAGSDATLTKTTVSAFSITADAGSYALTGTAASPLHNWLVTADPGSYSLTGGDVGLILNTPNKSVIAAPGSYVLTGTDAGTLHGWVVTASPGAYALTGTAVNLLHAEKIDATAGSYALTGTAASPLHGWLVTADPGAYALTGTDATLAKTTVGAFTIAADPGSYLLTGTPASLVYQSIAPVTTQTRGEWPEERKKRRQQRQERRTDNIRVARRARDALRESIARLYDGGDYDTPALEEVETEALATANAIAKLPELPLRELQVIEDLIRRIQELVRQRLLDETQTDMATQIARQHLADSIVIADDVINRTRRNYLARTLLLIAE